MPRASLFTALLCALAFPAFASFPGAAERGSAVYRYLGLPIYEARLLTPGGAALDWSRDFALELTYLRRFTRFDLVESTMQELERTGGAMPVRDGLDRCFADVARGDRFTAVTDGADRIAFSLNGGAACTLSHPGIAHRFMAIFLGPDSRSPAFTRALLGQ